MRNSFSKVIIDLFTKREKSVFITGDLGFNALEGIQNKFKDRFINVGVAEQNMIGVAAGISYNGFQVFCYSIAPFSVYRCYEQIKLDICIHNLPVCIVGNGGGYGYGIMGATHHAIEDIGCLSMLPNMTCWIPAFEEDVEFCISQIIKFNKPSYLRLGLGKNYPEHYTNQISFVNSIIKSNTPKITIVVLGPIIHNVIEASNLIEGIEIFTILTIPFVDDITEIRSSLNITKNLIVVEEHVQRGGLGEYLLSYVNDNKINLKNFITLNAKGYPSKTYGSQSFHQNESGLNSDSIKSVIQKLL